MCEIILVILLARQIAKICQSKGRMAVGWVFLFIGLWIGGEVSGAIIGVILSQGEPGMGAYVFALIGAAVGAVIAFVIVNSLPEKEKVNDEYGDDEYRRPRRRVDEGYEEKFREFRERGKHADDDADVDEGGRYRPGERD